jgi:small subunit ribosomal protein S16
VSVAIRLSRAGRAHLPYYHIGVFDSRTRRDGRPVEQLGFYDPESGKEPVRIDLARTKYWLSVGARPSATIAAILKGQGVPSSEWTPKKKAKKAAGTKPAAADKKFTKAAGKPAAKSRKARTANSRARGEKKRKKAG